MQLSGLAYVYMLEQPMGSAFPLGRRPGTAELPDVAMVIVGEHSGQALDLIRTIVHEAASVLIDQMLTQLVVTPR